MEVGEFAALSNIAMYEQRLQRTKEKALAHLRQLQETRSKEEIKNGFVFSKPAPSKIFWAGASQKAPATRFANTAAAEIISSPNKSSTSATRWRSIRMEMSSSAATASPREQPYLPSSCNSTWVNQDSQGVAVGVAGTR